MSEANIEPSPDSERPKMGPGDPFVDLDGFTKTQDFGLKYFVSQIESKFLSDFDYLWSVLALMEQFTELQTVLTPKPGT